MELMRNYENESCCNFVNQNMGWFIENSAKVVSDDDIAHKLILFQGFQFRWAEHPVYLAAHLHGKDESTKQPSVISSHFHSPRCVYSTP